MGPLLREQESEAGEVPGSALTEPLTAAVTEAIETLWRALGLEADRVVNDARQPFERDLKAEQAARTQVEAATMRTQEHLQLAHTTLASEQSAREQTTAALEQERLAQTRTGTQREAAQAQAAERPQLRNEALAERDGLRVELDSVRRQTDELTQALHREIDEQRTAHEQRVEALNEAHVQVQARSSIADQRSQLDALQRENTNLTTLNNGLSVRIDNTQSALVSSDAQLLALNAQRTAEQREMETLQFMMTVRFADKDALINSLQQQIAEPPYDPDAPVENHAGGV